MGTSDANAELGPVGPIDPVGPVAPVGPIGPVAPVAPVAPVSPVAPMRPWGPVGPMSPRGPMGPVAPIAPVGPAAPVNPISPCGPRDPSGPTGPRGPCGPVAPRGPVRPIGPCGPRGPRVLGWPAATDGPPNAHPLNPVANRPAAIRPSSGRRPFLCPITRCDSFRFCPPALHVPHGRHRTREPHARPYRLPGKPPRGTPPYAEGIRRPRFRDLPRGSNPVAPRHLELGSNRGQPEWGIGRPSIRSR